MVSEVVSHGSILGCCLKSVNHEQPASRMSGKRKAGRGKRAVRVARAANVSRALRGPWFRRSPFPETPSPLFPLPPSLFPQLALTADLLGSILLEDALDHVDLVGLRVDEHPVMAAAESAVVADGH